MAWVIEIIVRMQDLEGAVLRGGNMRAGEGRVKGRMIGLGRGYLPALGIGAEWKSIFASP